MRARNQNINSPVSTPSLPQTSASPQIDLSYNQIEEVTTPRDTGDQELVEEGAAAVADEYTVNEKLATVLLET